LELGYAQSSAVLWVGTRRKPARRGACVTVVLFRVRLHCSERAVCPEWSRHALDLVVGWWFYGAITEVSAGAGLG
jgi:hypothetical protein